MKAESEHADKDELQLLLQADEDSAEFKSAAEHVETCDTCRTRLDILAGATDIDDATRELLHDYPWESLDLDQHPPDALRAAHQTSDHLTYSAADLDFLGPPSQPELLGRLGRYEIESVIGQGGMGIVLKAHDSELNRPVAVKAMAQHLAHNGPARQRFARESRAAAAVVHEHVVAIHNVDADGDTPFLVMQFVAGESLQTRVDRDGPLDVKEILRVGIQTAAGLAAAHEQGVVHRDVKPGNILLENGVERALITDFGLARTIDDASLTQTGVITGTPHFMSPEQANGQPTDHRTDLFSLGAVLYFMATGHPPFRAERAMGVLNRLCHDRQKPLWQITDGIPDELSVLVDRLLEKQPARRLASAEVVRQQLTRLLADVQQPKRGLPRQLRRWALRYPTRSLAASALVVLLLAALAARPWLTSSPTEGVAREVTTNTDQTASGTPATGQPMNGRLMNEQPMNGRSQTVVADVMIPDSDSLARDFDELRTRLGKLDTPFHFDSDLTDAESPNLQSIHQRLERLQQSLDFESPIPPENRDATERN